MKGCYIVFILYRDNYLHRKNNIECGSDYGNYYHYNRQREKKTFKPVIGSKTVFNSAILTARAAAARNRETIENKKTGFCISIISLFISINRYTIAHKVLC